MPTAQLTRWRPQPATNQARRRAALWLQGATELALTDARRRAPVRTGRLRASIVPLPLSRDLHGHRAGLHATAPYALWVEIGTQRMRAQPYLRPTRDSVRAATPFLIARARVAIQ